MNRSQIVSFSDISNDVSVSMARSRGLAQISSQHRHNKLLSD